MTRSLPACLVLLFSPLLAACGLVAIVPPPEAAHLDEYPVATVVITSRGRSHPFTVWVADTAPRRSRGLTSVRRLGADRGMLFLFDRPTRPAMWMKNMTIPLDLLFISADGKILTVAHNVTPDSPRTIQPDEVVTGVIELPGGTATQLRLETGARIRHAHFGVVTGQADPPRAEIRTFKVARN